MNNYYIKNKLYNKYIYPILYKNDTIVTDAFYSDRNFLYEYREAEGNVLLIGLGLGIVPIILSNIKDVNSVTVFESDADLCKLIEPYLNKYGNNIKLYNIKDCDNYNIITKEIIAKETDNLHYKKIYDCIYFNIINIDNFYNLNNLQYQLIDIYKPFIKNVLKFAFCRMDYTDSIVRYYDFLKLGQ